jgi:hypothetical protein
MPKGRAVGHTKKISKTISTVRSTVTFSSVIRLHSQMTYYGIIGHLTVKNFFKQKIQWLAAMPERVGLLDDDGSRFLREYLVAGKPHFSKVGSTVTF